MRITLSELKEHNTPDDAWAAFSGKVYNITPYLPFHPGGQKELLRAAGRDGTKLFGKTIAQEVHISFICCSPAWVTLSAHTFMGQPRLYVGWMHDRVSSARIDLQYSRLFIQLSVSTISIA